MSTPPLTPLTPSGGKKDKFTPEMRILVASLLSMMVFLGWTKYFAPKPPANLQPSKPAATSTATPENPNTAATTPGGTNSPSTLGAAPGSSALSSSAPASSVPVTRDSEERTIVVENALYRVEFSNRGAVVKSWQLKKYKDDHKPQRTLDLVHPEAAQQTGGWPFSLVFDDPQLEKVANTSLYKLSGGGSSFTAPADLQFTFSDGHLEITKTYHFDHSYVVNVETTSTYNGARVLSGLAWRGGFGDWTVTDPSLSASIQTFYSENGKLSTFLAKKLEGPEKWGNVWQGGKTFTGVEDRYFTATFMAPADAIATPLETRYWKVWSTRPVDGKDQPEPVQEVATATSMQPMAMRVYVGPKDYDDLKAMHPPLNSLVSFGWMEFIADPLFHAMKWLHKYIPNWGWTIVVLTLVINMLLFPLRISSYKTTMKMQRVGPEIKRIQEKYKKYKINDPKKAEMNKEVMAIYQREGINPVGGCFQMFLQMPIWFGLNTALRGAIELRHASWLWIHDLASKDPYYILPVVVGVTMYLVSKMTPMTTTDPQQAQMLKIMPLSFSVMFVIFPFSSGLALYILTSSLVGILQQWYLNRSHPLPAPAQLARANAKK